jgi:ribosomal protein S18 acetylase RimI-like enzyme
MIRDLFQFDRQNWEKLYIAYAEFYKVPMNNEILDTVWSWLFNKKHVVNRLCYETEGKIVGIAHYRTMPRPLKGKYIGFLYDLFVDPNFRGKKIGQKLIIALKNIAKSNDWQVIRWITHSSNDTAKKLYDKLAINTGFDLYELKRN